MSISQRPFLQQPAYICYLSGAMRRGGRTVDPANYNLVCTAPLSSNQFQWILHLNPISCQETRLTIYVLWTRFLPMRVSHIQIIPEFTSRWSPPGFEIVVCRARHRHLFRYRESRITHPIEPQVMEAALQAQQDGVEMMVVADGSDLVFGGMDKMLSRDWDYDAWINFLTFLDPRRVLKVCRARHRHLFRYRESRITHLEKLTNQIF